MSETELPTGKRAAEQNAGISQLPEAAPQPEECDSYAPGDAGVHDAAADLGRMRDARPDAPIKRTLPGADPDAAGFIGAQKSVTVERAADELARQHSEEAEQQFSEHGKNLQGEIDRVRALAAGVPPPDEAPDQEASVPPPQFEEPPQQPASGLSPKVAAALQDPEIRAVLESAIAPAEQARQQYLDGLTQAAQLATAGVFARLQTKFPNVTQEQIPAAMSLLESQDPAFFSEIRQDAQRAVTLVQASHQASQQMQAEQHRAAQSQYQQYAKAQDDAFDKAVSNENPETVRAAGREIIEYAKSQGISEEVLGQIWASNSVIRSAPFQQMMYDAARYRMAQKTAMANPASRTNIPPVQKPGIAGDRSDYAQGDVAAAMARLKKSSGVGAARAAVDVLRAQRAARR